MDIEFHPLTFRTGNELIFLSAGKKTEFKKKQYKTVKRPMIWEWILEPFLNTEFTAETDEYFRKNSASQTLR